MKQTYLLLKTFSITAAILTSTITLSAQKGWEAGGWLGVSNYFGDLNTRFDVSRLGLAGGGIARYNFNDRLCTKMSANVGMLSANDKFSPNVVERQRNLNFRSLIIDAAFQFEFNFLPYNYFDRNQRFSPYLFAGFNVFNFNPKAKLGDTWHSLSTLGTEGQFKGEEYYTTQLGLVYGAGVKIALNEVWSINLELSARRLFTDYIDDVSTNYPKMQDLRRLRGDLAVSLSDPSLPDAEGIKLGLPGRQRGNSNDNDIYTFLSVGVLYYFGDLRCPDISKK